MLMSNGLSIVTSLAAADDDDDSAAAALCQLSVLSSQLLATE